MVLRNTVTNYRYAPDTIYSYEASKKYMDDIRLEIAKNEKPFNYMESNIWYRTKHVRLMGYNPYGGVPNNHIEQAFASVLYRPEENTEVSSIAYTYIRMYHYLGIHKYYGLTLKEFLNLTFREYYRLLDTSIYFSKMERSILETAESKTKADLTKIGELDGYSLY